MVKKRYGLVFALTFACLLTTVGSTVAVESGRYQAMQISVGKRSEYNIFILDTKEGHMWLLETRESRIDGKLFGGLKLSLIHISEPTRPVGISRMPSSA